MPDKDKNLIAAKKYARKKGMLCKCGNVACTKWDGQPKCDECIRTLGSSYVPKPETPAPKDMPAFWRDRPNAEVRGRFVAADDFSR